MPGAALHLTHIELLSRDPRVHTGLRRAMQREDLFMRFGAVLLDLPFYTSIVPMMLGYWLERPAEDCPFAVAEQFHSAPPSAAHLGGAHADGAASAHDHGRLRRALQEHLVEPKLALRQQQLHLVGVAGPAGKGHGRAREDARSANGR